MQQVASPITLYNEPDNLFVAGFIGSPQMNFIDAVAQKEGNNLYLAFSGQKVLLPAEKAQKLIDGGYVGKEVIMGVRPEDFHGTETSIARWPEDVVTADVNVTELLGADMHLYLIIGDNENIVATISARNQVKAGDRLKMAIDPAHIHVFDKETELTITN